MFTLTDFKIVNYTHFKVSHLIAWTTIMDYVDIGYNNRVIAYKIK